MSDNKAIDDENLKDKSSWGGARDGAGRPKGSMNQSSKDRKAAKLAYQERIANVADTLFNSQYSLAKGEQYLFRKYTVGSGTKAKQVTELVTDKTTIIEYLNDDLDVGDDEYYYISTKPANGMAIDSMLDRAFGKAEAKLDLTTDGESINGVSREQAEQLIRARANRSDS